MIIYIGEWRSNDWSETVEEMLIWCEENCGVCGDDWDVDKLQNTWTFENDPDGLMFILKFKHDS